MILTEIIGAVSKVALFPVAAAPLEVVGVRFA